MSKCSSGEVKKRKPRTSFDENDKRIFLNFIRNSEGGRFAKVITSKDSESESSCSRMLNDDPPEDDDEEESDDDSDKNIEMLG